MEHAPLVEKYLEREPDRLIRLNRPDLNEEEEFCGNEVSTTKYSLLSFFPKNLWEQFQRVANLYFLLISLVQIFSNASPTGKYNTFMTLCVVLLISAGKEAYEDWKRHQADQAQNQREVQVLRRQTFVRCEWSDLLVGDIIKVEERHEIPTDMVLLATSLGEGQCYVETSNLDGETNLKMRRAHADHIHLADDPAKLGALDGVLECSPPSMSMLFFEGRCQVGSTRTPLDLENLAMRGCRLRNTKWVVGLVVYTGAPPGPAGTERREAGQETKIMLNSTNTRCTPRLPVLIDRFKQSSLEKVANTLIIVVFIFELLLCVFASAAAGIWHSSYVGTGSNTAWYLQNEQSHSGFAAEAFLSFFILVSNLIPISLYVTMEVMKICLSLLIEQDIDMYSPVMDIPATAHTTNLSEELGQVGYVFSDKTGTLTSNEMEFRKCSIAGRVYTDDHCTGDGLREQGGQPDKRPFECAALKEAVEQAPGGEEFKFVQMLALCHTVLPEDGEPGEILYQGSSPDDVALVEAAAAMGIVFAQRVNELATLQVGSEGHTEEFKVLCTLDFSSDRKRMSVVIQRSDDSVCLICKGADTVIFPRLRSGQDSFVDDVCGQLQEFAAEGFRTLCIAYKEMDDSFWAEWSAKHEEARASMAARAEQLEALYEEMETDLDLIGVTAIEDKLQFGVPAAIEALSEAGIRTWMLTGDKSETAINIGFSCRLLNENMLPLIELTSGHAADLDAELTKAMQQMAAAEAKDNTALPRRQWGLVIEGRALAVIFDPVHGEPLLAKLVQKAEMVETIQSNVDVVTLAIGDGANDVSMLQAAHVGVGIAGREGLAAVNSSDYSFAQFRFLVPLLLWHGHNSYRRIAKLMLYFFYKNIVFNLPLYFYAIRAGWSGQSMYEPWSIMGYNVIFTALPVMSMALTDQDLPKNVLLARPELYKSGPAGYYFNVMVLIAWVLSGIWHSLLILWFIMSLYGCITSPQGKDMDIFDMGEATYTLVILVVTGKLTLEMHSFNWITYFALAVSLGLWFAWLFASNLWMHLMPEVYMSIYHLFGTVDFYLLLACCTITCLVRDYAWKYAKRVYFPTPYHIMQEALAQGTPCENVDINTGKRSGILRRVLMIQLARFASWINKGESSRMPTTSSRVNPRFTGPSGKSDMG